MAMRTPILHGSPSQYASAAVVHLVQCGASRWRPTSKMLRMHQPAAAPPLSFASPHTHGSAHSLTTKGQSDVGPLSCRVIWRTRIRTITARPSLLPTSQAGTPIDTPRGESSLTREVYRVSTFPFRSMLGQVPAVDREARRTREPRVYDSTDLQYRLVQACQPLSLVNYDGLYRRFRYLHHTSYLALTRLVVARKGRLSRIGPRPSRLERRYIVRAAT